MRVYIPFIVMLALSGCTDKNEDLIVYIEQVKARKSLMIDQMPDQVVFTPLRYSETRARNPFSTPRPEVVKTKSKVQKNCPQPNFSRLKGPLESYSLDELNMHGTLGSDKHLWGLVRSNSGELFRVAPGDYIGFNHGKIKNITRSYIELSELVLTGKGCWQVRKTKMPLSNQENS